ncbi:hypothetical protein [Paraburkholderia sp. J7]|uniref:hypothetical protein n=1 Tax=Paraburkholderia sp. J7 TaxID=2805438 RepID=UPI002AB72D71|nr:hypothetical protein [Paraburkholderia sp. J7]
MDASEALLRKMMSGLWKRPLLSENQRTLQLKGDELSGRFLRAGYGASSEHAVIVVGNVNQYRSVARQVTNRVIGYSKGRRMKVLLQTLIGMYCSFMFTSLAMSAAPTRFSIASDYQNPLLSLDSKIAIQLLDGDEPEDCRSIVLLINKSSKLSPTCALAPSRQVLFTFTRNGENQNDWQDILGRPFSQNRVTKLPLAIQIDHKELEFIDGKNPNSNPTITFQRYSIPGMILGTFAVFLVAFITVMCARKTVMIRDTVIPQMRRPERPYSLGRVQMAFWFCLIFSSFIFILTITGDLNSLNPESFTLLGLSSATALGAVAIDQTKNGPIANIEAAVLAIGLTLSSEVEELYTKAMDPVLAAGQAVQTIPNAPANSTYATLWATYQSKIAPIKSQGFIRDLVNDVNGPTIYRWQIMAWTLVLGVIYVGKVYIGLETPEFGTNLLAVMGISSGVYLGFKVPERQT